MRMLVVSLILALTICGCSQQDKPVQAKSQNALETPKLPLPAATSQVAVNDSKPLLPAATSQVDVNDSEPRLQPAKPQAATKSTQVRFVGPAQMKISCLGVNSEGNPGFGMNQVEAPGRVNLLQGAIYRLKLTNLPNRPGVNLCLTLEILPSNLKVEAFLTHAAVPIFFTEEDLDQIAGNNLVKVIYLPNPLYPNQAIIGPDEIVSSRLDSGDDPILEAAKRGTILLVIRGNNSQIPSNGDGHPKK